MIPREHGLRAPGFFLGRLPAPIAVDALVIHIVLTWYILRVYIIDHVCDIALVLS
jgi:hypothetical protein